MPLITETHGGQRAFIRHVAQFRLPPDGEAGAGGFDFGQRREQGQAQQLRHRGRNAAGLTVGGAVAEDHEVELEGLESLGQRVGRALDIGAGERGVGDQHSAVGAHGQGLADGLVGLFRPHAEHRDLAAMRLLKEERLLDRVLVVRVEDGVDAPVEPPGFRVEPLLGFGIDHLFHANDDVHQYSLLSRGDSPRVGTALHDT